MSDFQRVEVPSAPVPTGVFAIRAGNITVFRDPQTITREVSNTVHRTDANGNLGWRSPDGGTVYYAEGAEVPDGYVKETYDTTDRVDVVSRGLMTNVEVIESDADGNQIERNAPGYQAVKPFDHQAIMSLPNGEELLGNLIAAGQAIAIAIEAQLYPN